MPNKKILNEISVAGTGVGQYAPPIMMTRRKMKLCKKCGCPYITTCVVCDSEKDCEGKKNES